MGKLSLLFKGLSDPLRLRIVRLLLRNGREAYGEEIAKTLGIPPYRLSRHLKVLTTIGLIRPRREGRLVYYSLAKTNGELLGMLRRLIADLPAQAERPRKAVVKRSRSTKAKQEAFNWDQGPAIPGML